MIETQLHLRGRTYEQVTAKPLYAQPAGPRPERRTDGYQRKGPQGLQNIAVSKASSMLSELPPPPPVPPRIVPDP